MHKKIISILIAFIFLAVTSGFAIVSSIPDQTRSATFRSLALDVARMDKFYSGGNGAPVIFDAKSASKAGFSKKSIVLAQEMANFTNDLVKKSSPSAKGIQASDVNIEISISYVKTTYPHLAAFYKAANAFASQQTSTSDVVPEYGDNFLTYYTCGYYTWPRPSKAAAWKTFNKSDAAATLKSWGYHETPSNAGGGWTRDQTYSWAICGLKTYRDHAYITDKNKVIHEQNYEGFTPRGEPNPELWRVGPWPYATWPVYAYWWHQTH